MDCNVVKDLLPLFIDECCSEESKGIVKEHIDSCPDCRELYEKMSVPTEPALTVGADTALLQINSWKASILQSVLLFASFAIITAGVALEAGTPLGFTNGFWAMSLVVPATGFLLSTVNWYFVKQYKNRKRFSNCSALATLGITACAYIWTGFHYELSIFDFAELIHGMSLTDFLEMMILILYFCGIGFLLTAVFCVLSKILSNRYAKMLGKE